MKHYLLYLEEGDFKLWDRLKQKTKEEKSNLRKQILIAIKKYLEG